MTTDKRDDRLTARGGSVQGTVQVAGDKSISHRAIMIGALADGVTRVEGFLAGEDCLATLAAFRSMGVRIEGPDAGRVTIHGVGREGLRAPEAPLDMGNSGTSMRLLAGLLAAQPFPSELTGDESLRRRPMGRVVSPLTSMGGQVAALGEEGRPPLRISPVGSLKGINYELPVASAQVKSAILLAGLYADGETCVTEPAPTRDHTERMLSAFGYPVRREGSRACLQGGARVQAADLSIPGDLSSAAFFLVAAAMVPGSDLLLEGVGINPTRRGALDILLAMGAHIELQNERTHGGEPVADLRVRGGELRGIEIPSHLVPLAIDEFPAIFVAAAAAEGRTVLRDAAELRVKESDRIQTMADGLQALGIAAVPLEDGLVIDGGPISGGRVDAHGDHRVAMAFAVASIAASGPISISGAAAIRTSFPDFLEVARAVGLRIEAENE
ncbi:3-phosphoshikimate 1-carboxyvinyltransferase [Thiohalorhabdus methylotrophus]|uniref:3-phosphoshikimate 1-carboxyvinyltransferase n=1 Tax=Thiohalorhabdus methylotrophus TaxID=3242694 RepID=A0ABV4U0R2_9GAMM